MGSELAPLLHVSASEAAELFAAIDAGVLVAALRATPDDELAAVLGRDEVRAAAVEGILSRLHEYAVPERLAQVHGTVRFDLEHGRGRLERCGLVVDDGTVTFLPDLPASAPADVVLRTGALLLLRLVSGERNAGLEYLSGSLDIEGDAQLALAVGGLFRVPDSGEVAVDPTALDPVDVVTALRGVRPAHLAKVMSSGFRPVVLGEIFRRLPDFVDDRKARGADLVVAFRLLGNPTGEIDRFTVRVADGVATVSQDGEAADPATRDATVTCEAHDFLRLATGHLGAVTGVLRGQLKVRGDKAKALQLSSLIDIPAPR